ncbi:methyl-accepting chemotaxis sensory transducer [Rhodopseudomonas faecalis]|uniref:Methyl-accepting chemotaxis sensory transducer n=1 Tax=Rhodopseudomonas faecalis TaxID=99655 RepID=A0A318TAZ3_9BRAD|nr:methyl-accepting chemotaxis protein [Rhodopseudomonas faecalis]PYF02151.1 methyl-accepting chemotaxis sensory transducer [Rhodopseudomonas faecalis]TAH67052.1 MAG: methyl-accepting chemotaxis protein [Rhodopseudomonas palustris]
MKIRLSISMMIVIFAATVAVGLAAMLTTSTLALKQLRVGGPLYTQIKLGNDLVADILPPPAYIIEAYLEATLALRQPADLSDHAAKLAKLHKDYSERKDYWTKSDLDDGIKKLLTADSDAEVQKFWSTAENELLPALAKGDMAQANAAYAKLEASYLAHRAIIDAIVTKAIEGNAALETTAATEVGSYSAVVWTVSGLVITIIALGVFGIAIGLVRPVVRLTAAMEGMAAGNLAIEIPGADRGDEIGGMAKAVSAIRENAEQKARDEAEAKRRQDQLAAEQRKADMARLADSFEGAVGEIVETVSTAANELEQAANTLLTSAERSLTLATGVAQSSEQASSSVQSVASASEELTASVHEISRQVHTSAQVATQAVDQASKTNNRVSELSNAAARIGDVVELINTIAGQTNLLALNATIEAARAGEAGRGFAVVASEVKALAEQTARATGEIGQQINGIQAATAESVSAIQEIGGIIRQMSEISSTIASAVEEQGAATQEISGSIQSAAQGTSQVTADISSVQGGARETGAASAQVLSAAQSLAGESNRLKAEVSNFLRSVRAA